MLRRAFNKELFKLLRAGGQRNELFQTMQRGMSTQEHDEYTKRDGKSSDFRIESVEDFT
jgi:hypothetical protein